MTKHHLIAAAFLLATPLFAASQDRLATVLAQMDTASAHFKSAQADLIQENYERVVRETTTDKGSVYFKGQGPTLEMGLKLDPPTARLVDYKNGIVRVYDPPPVNQITEIRSGQVATYLAVAFGGSGKELARAWDITDKGPEQIDGVSVEHLDLVSKDPEARAKVSHVEIWVDPTRAISLKQQVFLPGGNYKISTYRNIRYNRDINTGPYTIKPDKHTTVTHP
jgi:outer membrane lipoprotein-sorting protein